MISDVFVKASIINLAWSKVQIFLTYHGLMVAVTIIKLHPWKNVLTSIKMLLGRFLSLTSAKDNERMWRASEVVIDYGPSIASYLNRCNYEKQIQ